MVAAAVLPAAAPLKAITPKHNPKLCRVKKRPAAIFWLHFLSVFLPRCRKMVSIKTILLPLSQAAAITHSCIPASVLCNRLRFGTSRGPAPIAIVRGHMKVYIHDVCMFRSVMCSSTLSFILSSISLSSSCGSIGTNLEGLGPGSTLCWTSQVGYRQ